ncbi:MBL fold metallo-hydrolase [Piscinibacter koreensis]|uniref:MBL fold metallo-hydrolase n=1 Tax=Piscinibacter koreensis TaxID=2742824 RepID=A0A7Y6TYH0_9BURK|nr:MBL fold metallo-hydrolase [Schlegelella koreensis]NUZ08194.1 MBL fold metallo-hydrolase [Schlegelella koreensis]
MSAAPVLLDEATRVWRVTAGVFASNCYLVGLGGGARCAVVDPGLGTAAILDAIDALGLEPAAVLCTHGHFDHVGSAAVIQREHGCPVYLPADDVATMRSSNFLLMAFKIDARIELPEVTVVARAQPLVDVGGETFTFHLVPGHTPGSCIVRSGTRLFTGDTLYARGVGLSKLPGERPVELRRSLAAIWDLFPADAQVYPGHGDSASLGWIRDNNTALQRFLQAADETSHKQ